MVLQEQISGPQLNSVPSFETTISVDDSTHMPIEDGQVPKVRKAYTITKQRERWTDDEHDKFLEALKLHGRAWKKIEEHIGTKTAVQIRSHAQKFFSKVVRVTSSSNASSTDPIEIPPPRPKRKPSHPYPRKHVLPAKKQNSLDKRESQSPTSVLSADSTEPDGSASPISSSVEAVNPAEFLPSEDTCQDEMHVSANTNDLVSEKLERFPSIDSYDKPEPVSTKVIKLFGKDLVVPINECLSKSPSSDMGEAVIQASPEVVQPMDLDMQNQAFYCVDGSGNQVEKPVPLPWWVFFQGMTVPQFESYTTENAQEKDGSCVGSSSESVRPAEIDSCWDAESRYERCRVELNKECKASKGFVPYKRCYSGRDMQSSSELCL